MRTPLDCANSDWGAAPLGIGAEFLGSPAVNDPSGVNLVRAVLEGVKIRSPRGDNLMPSFAAAYSDAEIAAVSNYVIGHFGGKRGKVTAADVRASRD